MSKTRMGKRVASLLLSLVMMLSLLPTTVYAEGADTGDTTDEIVGQATTSGDNTEGTGEPEPTGEGEDGAATNDAVVEETIAPVNAEGVDAVANAESSGDEVSGEDGSEATSFVTVNGGTTQYATLEAAIAAAEPVNGVITYNISGKVDVTATGWVQVATAGLTDLTAVKFVGKTNNAEICITGELAILADESHDINVSFEALTLSKQYPTYAGDYGHSTKYFTTWLRNTNAAENTVTYTNCTFPNGVCNNQYGKTVFDNCQFTNATGGLYNLWNYGGNTEVKDSTFTGTRGIKAYSEGTDGGSIKVAGTKFDNLTQKAAIVASKPVNVEVSNVDVTGEKGFFTRDITGNDEVQLTVAGTGISGTFEITSATDAGAAKDEFNISAGTFTSKVSNDYCADGFEVKANADGTTYGVVEAATAVAQIGETTYETLQAAINVATAGQTVTLLADATEDVVINKNITLDLGGKTLTNTSTGKATISVTGGTVTVKNGSVVGGTSYYNIEVTKDSNANLTLEDVTATAGNTASAMIDNYGDLTINSGTYTGGLDTVKNEPNANLTINDGTFTLTKGTSKGFTGVVFNYGALKISGGTFMQSDKNAPYGQAQVIHTDKSGSSTPSTVITGGTFKNLCTSSTTAWTVRATNAAAGATKVSGGAFNKKVSDSYCADGFIPTKNADGTYGVKEGKYVAEVGSKKYETLADAIRLAANGKTVKLLADCASDRINLEKSITVDLNGKVLTSTAEYGVMFCAKNGKTITINGTTEGSKLVGTLMVTNGTYGHIVINGGTYESDKYCPIYINGAVSTDDSTLTVTNATIKALAGNSDQDNGVAVYLAGYSTSTFTNTTITAPVTGLEIRAGKLTLTDCNVTGGNGTVAAKADGSGSTVANAAVAISQHTTKKDIDVTINGGTYTATAAVYQTDVQGTGSEGVKASIKSGTFNGTVSAETNNTVAVSGGSFSSAVPKNCCAAGYIPVANDGGTHGVKGPFVAKIDSEGYATLQAAIDAATRNQTVTMLANTEENVTIAKALTLDLNGFTLNGGTVAGTPTLKIDTARVTVMDSSEAKTGTIMREDTAENSGVSSHYVIDIQGKNALLIFNSGNVRNNSGNTEGKGASLVRVGDDNNKKAHPVLTIAGGTFTQDNFIVIKVDFGTLHLKGGTVNSKTSYAVENWLNANIKGDAVVNGAVSSWTYSTGSNSTLEISGGTINGNIESVSYDGAAGKKASVSITGGVVNGMLSTHIYNKETEPSKDIATIEVTGGTFSSDPTKYLVECSTVTPNADGTFGVKKAYLAKVGNTSYYTMEEAFKAQTASGEPIVMLRDYTTGSSFWSGSIDRTVELGGHTWTCTGTDANSAAFEINYPNASLTVKNGKIVSSQLVGLIPSASGGTYTYDNSSLTFENVKMSTTATSGIETNGNNTNDTVTLKDSTLDVPNGFGIYFPSSGKLTIDNSTITAKTMGVQVCAGSLSINAGSAITVSGDAVSKTENDGAIQDGAAISIVNRTGYKGLGNVTVTGGTFKANGTNAAIKAYKWENQTASAFDNSKNVVAVSGGTFSSAVPEGLCAEGYISVANANGTHTVKEGVYVAQVGSTKYESLADAIAAAQDGQTVMLLADVNGNVEIAAGKNLTLDLNGKILNGGTVTGKAALTNYGTITIKDSSEEKTGTIKRDDNGTAGYYVIRNQGKMTIESGTVTNNSGYAKANSTGSMIGSSLICNGDCDGVPTLTIQGGTFTQDNFIAIKNGALGVLHVTGGTITSKHSAIQNWFKADITGGEITGQLWTDAYMVGESVGVTTIGGDAKFTGEIVMDIYGSVAPTLAITGGNLEVTKWNITKAAANVGAKPAVSGGTFSSKVPAEYCAPGYVPTGEGADGRFTVAEGEFIVQVTSRTVSSNTHVANVSGGGSNITYAVGTTVTAASLSGYKFVGWFVNEYTGTPYSTDLTCKVKPTDDCTMIAVYKPVEGGIFELTVNASKFTVNDGAVQTSYLLEKIDVGASVTVKFKGTEKFLYWVNESKKVVSTNPEYTFYMGSATTLNAVYAEKQENQAMVVFVSLSGQVISSKSYTDKQPITFPEPPIKMGATFEKWSMTEAQIRAAMATTETGIIIVEPVYVSNETEATVTITYPDQTTDTKTGTVGKVITLTAKSIEGKEFKCWKYDGMTLGYTETLKVAPRGTMNLEAVYVTAGEPVTRTPVIELTEISASKLDEKYVVSFTATRSVPENYTVIGQGVLASTNSKYAEKDALEAMKLDSKGNPPAGVFKYADEGTDSIGVTVANGKTSYADRVVYGRAYMILKNTKTGATEYYYGSEILSNSYNGLTSNGGN